MHEFDGVFDCDNVVFTIFVRVIHHCRQRRGFAGTRRAGHDDQSAIQQRKLFENGRQRRVKFFKILERKHAAGNLAEHSGDAVFLIEKIDAETRDFRDFVAEVHVARFLEGFDFVIRRDFVEHGLEGVILQRGIIHALKLAVYAQHRRVAR